MLPNCPFRPRYKAGLLRRMCSFEGAHVAITGGGSGIGLELARQFVLSGAAAISLLDISGCASALASLKAEQAGLSTQSNVKYFQADVTEYIQVRLSDIVAGALIADLDHASRLPNCPPLERARR